MPVRVEEHVRPRRWPDLFVVGAPKCGTTALYAWLDARPDVFMSPVKEPQYFGRDLVGRRFIRTREEYLGLFAAAADERYLGEASTWSLYSRSAAEEIRAASPSAHVIVMVRNPVDLIHSLHSQFVWTGNEDLWDIEEALAAEPDRRAGRRIPDTAHLPQGLLYREVAGLGTQVERYVGSFDRDRLHVIVLEELREHPEAVLTRLLGSLRIPATPFPAFRSRNENKTVRSPVAHRLLTGLLSGRVAARARELLPASARRPLERLVDGVSMLNARRASRSVMPEGLRRRLEGELVGEVRLLQELVEQDLARWFGPWVRG